jgi:hypothetical protein
MSYSILCVWYIVNGTFTYPTNNFRPVLKRKNQKNSEFVVVVKRRQTNHVLFFFKKTYFFNFLLLLLCVSDIPTWYVKTIARNLVLSIVCALYMYLVSITTIKIICYIRETKSHKQVSEVPKKKSQQKKEILSRLLCLV